MASDSELKNLGEAFTETLRRLSKAGVDQMVQYDGSNTYIRLSPMTYCPKHNRLSPASRCLWCEPEEFKGEGVA